MNDLLSLLLLLLSLNGSAFLLAAGFTRYRQRLRAKEEPLRQEILERQHIEHLLRNELTLLAKVMEASPAGILIIDEQGSIVGASDRAEGILGLSKEELSRGEFNLDRWRPLDDRGDPLSPNVLPFQQVLEEQQTAYDCRYTIELPDGRILRLSISANPILDETNELAGVVFLIEDITERSQVENALLHSEAQFRGIFEQAAVGIAIMTLSGHFIRVNQRYCELTGYTNEELREKTVLEITAPDDRQRHQERYESLSEQGLSFSLEKRYLCRDGSLLWVNLTASAIRDVNGELMYLIGIIEDIDERKQAVSS
jgi:PAS domain S-box-containing protein